MKRLLTGLATFVLIASALFVLASCGDDDKKDGDSTATPQATADATSTAGETATPGTTGPDPTVGETFEGAQDPVQGTLGFETPDATRQATLVRVETAQHEGFDRIVFEFAGPGAPVYRVEYVAAAEECASGEPVFAEERIVGFIQIKFMPAVAHDEAGQVTIPSRDINANLPAIMRAKQSCDFEADVTWVVLLTERTDFRVLPLVNPLRLAVDVAHP